MINFSLHPSVCRVLESIAVGISNNEAILLVGETGTGKTSTVQYLANNLGTCLRMMNFALC